MIQSTTILPPELQAELSAFIYDRIESLKSETGPLNWNSWSDEAKYRFIDVSANRFLKNHANSLSEEKDAIRRRMRKGGPR